MEHSEYLLLSTACLSVCFLFYKLVFSSKRDNLQQMRFYLLLIIFVSILIPFSNYKIHLNIQGTQALDMQINKQITTNQFNEKQITAEEKVELSAIPQKMSGKIFQIDYNKYLWFVYFLICSIFLSRILITSFLLVYRIIRYKKTYHGNYVYVFDKTIKNSFSFFNWIFIQEDFKENKEIDGILLHEKVHSSQFHSFDIIVIELLAAVMWFNPLVWMMRKEIQLVHEYLADEGALSTGIDRLKYQALLVNQVTEERLICLSSSFNHSLIKKRMIMMTKQKFNQGAKLKILTLIPLAAILLLGVACVNGQNKSNNVTAVAPVKMNVLYIGVDNPIVVAASGYEASQLDVEVDNGKIIGENGIYVLKPAKTGVAIVKVWANKELIQESQFRVKRVPNPMAGVSIGERVIADGEISKDELMQAESIVAFMQNFDFDLSFEVVEHTFSTYTADGFLYEQKSNSGEITKEQLEVINKINPQAYNRLYIQDIKCKGPDGAIRNLPTISLVVL